MGFILDPDPKPLSHKLLGNGNLLHRKWTRYTALALGMLKTVREVSFSRKCNLYLIS
jgi:hypothetical protein